MTTSRLLVISKWKTNLNGLLINRLQKFCLNLSRSNSRSQEQIQQKMISKPKTNSSSSNLSKLISKSINSLHQLRNVLTKLTTQLEITTIKKKSLNLFRIKSLRRKFQKASQHLYLNKPITSTTSLLISVQKSVKHAQFLLIYNNEETKKVAVAVWNNKRRFQVDQLSSLVSLMIALKA